MNTAGRLVLLVLAILVAIALLTITIVYSVVPKNTETGPTQPIQNTNFAIPSGMNQAYTNAAGGAFNVNENKPFVVNMRREAVTQCSFTFSDMPFSKVTQAMSVGFAFYVLKPQVLVSLQCVDQYFVSGDRQVGIFEYGTRKQLISAPVSKTMGGLVQGLRTNALLYNEQVQLFPNILYVCLGQILAGDYKSLENANTALFANNISFFGTCSVTGPALTLPSNVNPSPFEVSPFPGFQLRDVTPLEFVPAFRVDTQSASMPVNYIADFNFEAFANSIRVSPGACASQSGVYNIQMFKPQLVVTTGMAFNANSWYAVYVANNQSPLTIVMLSANFPEPRLTQNELAQTMFRRIGFVKTTSDPTKFVPAVQTGPETRRTMTFRDPSQFAQIVELKDNGLFTLPLDMVAPTTNICTLQIELRFEPSVAQTPSIILTFGNFSTVMFRAGQSYQIQQTVLQLSSSFVPRAIAVQCTFDAPYSETIPHATFTILDYTEDI